MAIFESRIHVWGRSPFPIDMLRYDNAFPDTERDADMITSSVMSIKGRDKLSKTNPITLVVRHDGWSRGPTTARWNSFMWMARIVK